MTLRDGFRLWFLVLYGFGTLSFIVMIIRYFARKELLEKKTGPLPSPGILFPIGIPLIILLLQVGELSEDWLIVRLLGLILSLYFVVIFPWMFWTLGRFALPGTGIMSDHQLVTIGPYRYVRHPLYSAAVVLWLAAAIGTLNWLLLVLWPAFVVLVFQVPIKQEEELLYEKFGEDYEDYAKRTSGLIPDIW